MQAIPVALAHGSYNILVGRGLIRNLDAHLKRAGLHGPFLILTQSRILRQVAPELSLRFPVMPIPDGEGAKRLPVVGRILDRMVKLGLTRQSTLIALGGGVVGDVGAFAASIFMRGIAVVQVPTTLLAQVDSSIGGKTGVNHRGLKNIVGSFHQPSLVLSDIDTLESLPPREYSSGLYEALKYGLICDPVLFENFRERIALLRKRDRNTIEDLVSRCAAIKAGIVAADEREGDLRRVLNFGHTIGHGLESAAGLRRLKHGEAVGYGMIAAARISAEFGHLSKADCQLIESTIASVEALPSLKGLKIDRVMDAIGHDKKVRDGAVHFVLPVAIGQVEITPKVPLDLVRTVVKNLIHESAAQR